MAEKRTHEQFLIELEKINNRVKVLDKYINSKTKILCECLDCGNQWMVKPEKLFAHRKCPKCSRANKGLKSRNTHKEFIEKMNKIHPNIEVLSQYVLSHEKVLCRCKLDNYEWETTPSSLLTGSGCPKCSKNIRITHTEFLKRVSDINKDIKILGEYTRTIDKIKCECLKDGNIWYPKAQDLLKGLGCPVCSNHMVKKGVNDIATTHPYMVKYFVNIFDAETNTYGSSKKIKLKCPICGNIQIQSINKLTSRGFSCQRCSDGISYPNKFIYSFLDQLGIKFEREKSFEWSDNKKYDIYIPSLNIIIENHGAQHYRYCGFPIDPKDVQKNDKHKENLALVNLSVNYITLDCRESTQDFIQLSIYNSQLKDIFDCDKVDFKKCHRFALTSTINDIVKMWNKGLHNTQKISDIMGISRGNVIDKLNKANELGLCEYNGDYEATKHSRVKVKCIETNQMFNSLKECADKFKITTSTKYASKRIRQVCDGELDSYNNLHFKYLEE